MTSKEELAQINEKIKKVTKQKASVLAKLENLAKRKMDRKVKKAKREPLQKEWQRLWDELKELYAKRKDLTSKKKFGDQKKVEELKKKKSEIQREIEEVKKDPKIHKFYKKPQIDKLQREKQMLQYDINYYLKGEEKEEDIQDYLQKSNIDEKYLEVVKDTLEEVRNLTPSEIFNISDKELKKGLLSEIKYWSFDVERSNIIHAWRSIQQRKTDVHGFGTFIEERNKEYLAKSESKRKHLETLLVRMKVLTTQFYKKQGINEIKLYRGVRGTEAKKVLEIGEEMVVNMNPASSWSTSKSVAKKFGNVVLAKTIPIHKVILSYEVQFEGFTEQVEKEIVIDGEGVLLRSDNVFI